MTLVAILATERLSSLVRVMTSFTAIRMAFRRLICEGALITCLGVVLHLHAPMEFGEPAQLRRCKWSCPPFVNSSIYLGIDTLFLASCDLGGAAPAPL